MKYLNTIKGGLGGALGACRARRGAKHGAKRTPECADPAKQGNAQIFLIFVLHILPPNKVTYSKDQYLTKSISRKVR
jgi:hypothetical protein